MEKNKSRSKKKKILIIVGLILFILVFARPHLRKYLFKSSIINIVRDNLEVLNTTVGSRAYKDALEIDGIKDIDLYRTEEGNTYIEYYCKGVGIVSSSIYYGFFYHSIDEPIGFQGVNHEFIKKGKGWYWSQVDGDNYCYVEKIDKHWYYYEAGF